MSFEINFKPLTTFARVSILHAALGSEFSYDVCISNIQQ